MIVDCHTHWGMGWEDRDQGDPTAWLEVLDRHQVDQAFLLGHYSLTQSERTTADNDRLARLRDQVPDRLVPFGTCWPHHGVRAVDEAIRCLDRLGLAGLKFHPWLQGFSLAEPVLADICALAGERGVPIIFHDGTPCYSLPEQVAGLARRFPQTRFVLGHAGLLWAWRSALAVAGLANLWTCLCGPHQRGMEILSHHAPADRLLWGSDFGFGFADPIDYRLGQFRRSRIPAALQQAILGANPQRLLRPEGALP